MSEENYRSRLNGAKRVVIKTGSRVLVRRDGKPDTARIEAIVRQIAKLRGDGVEVILVSSGAIGAGMNTLGIKKRPATLPELQMAAAVGQSRLIAMYDQLFVAEGCPIGQVLLTQDGLKQRERHLNARNTILTLLRNGIIPIVNENDAVAVDDIRFGDNDILAALVSILVDADLLILLTTVNGLRKPAKNGQTRRVPFLEDVTEKELALDNGKSDTLSSGGITSKLQAAKTAAETGTSVVICDGRMRDIITRAIAAEDVGTLIAPATRSSGNINRRKRWIAFFHRTRGTLIIDSGARMALAEKGRSLLPIGISSVEGSFPVGTSVHIKTADGTLVARGLVEYSSDQIKLIKGRKTSDIESILGSKEYDEVVHRDNMVLLKPSQEGIL